MSAHLPEAQRLAWIAQEVCERDLEGYLVDALERAWEEGRRAGFAEVALVLDDEGREMRRLIRAMEGE